MRAGKSVLIFGGYSASGYEDPQVMLVRAGRKLAARRPADTLVNIGATAVGIGAAYDVAKRLGFKTMGIVSSLAREETAELSRCVDLVFYVPDRSWGGLAAPERPSVVNIRGHRRGLGKLRRHRRRRGRATIFSRCVRQAGRRSSFRRTPITGSRASAPARRIGRNRSTSAVPRTWA
jgi:hypothetical protein